MYDDTCEGNNGLENNKWESKMQKVLVKTFIQEKLRIPVHQFNSIQNNDWASPISPALC